MKWTPPVPAWSHFQVQSLHLRTPAILISKITWRSQFWWTSGQRRVLRSPLKSNPFFGDVVFLFLWGDEWSEMARGTIAIVCRHGGCFSNAPCFTTTCHHLVGCRAKKRKHWFYHHVMTTAWTYCCQQALKYGSGQGNHFGWILWLTVSLASSKRIVSRADQTAVETRSSFSTTKKNISDQTHFGNPLISQCPTNSSL